MNCGNSVGFGTRHCVRVGACNLYIFWLNATTCTCCVWIVIWSVQAYWGPKARPYCKQHNSSKAEHNSFLVLSCDWAEAMHAWRRRLRHERLLDYEVNESDRFCNRTRGRCRWMGPQRICAFTQYGSTFSPPTMHLSSLLLFSSTLINLLGFIKWVCILQWGIWFQVEYAFVFYGHFKLGKIFLQSSLLN